jgi:hypothetical protein
VSCSLAIFTLPPTDLLNLICIAPSTSELGMQQTQPNQCAYDLTKICVHVAIIQSEHEEFIEREHAGIASSGRTPNSSSSTT